MNFSPQQERALDRVGRWLEHSDDQVFRLFGFAGTGKTTIARHLAAQAGDVIFGAYTGKAAYVLQRSGCEGATTLHSLIYTPKERSKQRLKELQEFLAKLEAETPRDEARIARGQKVIAEERANLRRPLFALKMDSEVRDADLLIVDEVSMVDQRMGEDLLSFGTKILVLGDPAQLPPVKGEGFFTRDQPDVMLTEIHRQARDNPIVDMAARIREGDFLDYGDYGSSEVMDWGDIEPRHATRADQIIVGTNKTRKGVNRRTREEKGFGDRYPMVGERLVCLKNNHEKGLLNGAIYIVETVGEASGHVLEMTVRDEGSGDIIAVDAHVGHFEGYDVPYWEARDTDQFDFGYGLTCHKSQGSQWDDVLIFDESKVFGQNRRRWLYTAVTRAAQRVTVVR